MNEKILIVDDEKHIRDVLCLYLKKAGYQVMTAENGQEGLELTRKEHPSIIISDSMMPVMDGLEFCSHVKNDETLKDIFFIILTGKNSVEDNIAGLDGGADDYLNKPFNNRELVARITAFSRISSLQRELKEKNAKLIEAEIKWKDALEIKEKREQELSVLMENISVGIAIINPETRIIENINSFAASLIGETTESIMGHRCHSYICPAEEHHCPVCDNGQSVDNSEKFLLCADKSKIPILKTVKKVKINGKEKLLESFIDITERKQAEELLRDKEATLELSLRSAAMGVWEWDIANNRRTFDVQACSLLGINKETFDGSAAEFLAPVHAADRDKIKEALAKSLATDTLYAVEYRVTWPDGSLHHIKSRGRLYRDPENRPLKISGIIWDVTERRVAEEEKMKLLDKMYQQALIEQKIEGIIEVGGTICHEINQPLTALVGYVDILLMKLPPDQVKTLERINKIKVEATRMSELTRRLNNVLRKKEFVSEEYIKDNSGRRILDIHE